MMLMPVIRMLATYTVLTIGDGLVTVIPALMISISGGLIVTRASSDVRLGAEFRRQVFGNAQPLMLAGGVLLAMAAFPGLPKLPFLVLGVGLGAVAWRMSRAPATAQPEPAAPPPAPRENLEALLRVEPIAIELGLGLVRLVEGGQNSPLLRRIAAIRRQLVLDLGFVLPAVRVTDNLSLRSREYVILIKGAEVARYEMRQGMELALHSGQPSAPIEGEATREPAFGLPALWIRPEQAEAARAAGYTVVDAVAIIGTHLSEIVRRYAHELFSRQDAKRVLDRVAEENPKVVEDLVPKLLPLATVQRVLQNLLREHVSIRDAVTILEALGEAAQITRNPVLLTEFVRQAIRRTVVKPYLNRNGDLPAYLLDPAIEQEIEAAVEHGEHASHLGLSPQRMRAIVDKIRQAVGSLQGPAVLITSSGARYFLRQMLEQAMPRLYVLAHNEIPPETRVVSLKLIQ